MNHQAIYLAGFLLLLLLLIFISEILHRFYKLPTEQSRKFLHVSAGLMCLLLPSFFSSHWWVLALGLIAFLLLIITYWRKLLPSVHQTRRQTVGSILFPIPVYVCFLMATLNHNEFFFYVPVSLLTISDTAAEMGGHRWGHLTRSFFKGQKTIAGMLSFFVTAVIVCFAWIFYLGNYSIVHALEIALLIALLTAIAETMTLHGWDNITVPLVAVGLLYLTL